MDMQMEFILGFLSFWFAFFTGRRGTRGFGSWRTPGIGDMLVCALGLG